MYESVRPKAATVIGPFGPITIADLPPPGPLRWSIRRKAEVIAAVRGGLLSLEEACIRYALNAEEYFSWEYCVDRHGLAGLRTTRTQFYRSSGTGQRRRRHLNRQTNGRSWNSDTVTSTSREPMSNTEGGKLFAVLGFGSGFTEGGGGNFCHAPPGGALTDKFCMTAEWRSDFNVAWCHRICKQIKVNWCDMQSSSAPRTTA